MNTLETQVTTWPEQVLASWSHVSGNAFRVLVRMAATACDADPRPTYSGGQDLLAMTLRQGLPGNPAMRQYTYRAVKRAVAELVEAGAIERKAVACGGRRAVYELNLERPAVSESRP